ncbi:MAG TPA: ricin-type beta-trefoil lectin domain protein [Candidatus Saccharimonadales bacterium]|nr:ricin-type beta-trefoil lectin domain protein [Candidatus Saccharimonadales bacterium]
MRIFRAHQGFALPTVVITSVVMFAILTAVMGMVASTSSNLDIQYYEGIAADAAESGAAHANDCLKNNGYVSSWGVKTLTPATDCTGTVVSGQAAYIVSTSSYRTSYSVSPVTSSNVGTQTATITGTTSMLRPSGTVWKTYAKTLIVKTGGQISASQVVFGYSSGAGAFFGTVGADGVMRTVGYNGQGQLGNGGYSSTLTPQVFQVPGGARIVSGFTSFVSLGIHMYALDSNGNAYGAGWNGHGGELGVGQPSSTSSIPTPAKVVLPGKQISFIMVGYNNNYFLTTDNNVYAAGACANGLLGSNYTISGCVDQSAPVRVNLPTPTGSDPNTIPTNNITTDRDDVYVRMAGGRVYGWGANYWAQLGGDNFVPSSTPVQIGTYGDPGQPKATQVFTDGSSMYILDSTGHVNSLGLNNYGQMGTNTTSLVMAASTGKCVDNENGDGVTFWLFPCNGTPAQKYQLRSDGSVYNAATGRCLDNSNADGVSLHLNSCNGSAAERFVWDANAGTLYNAQANKCVDNKYGDGTTLWLYSCIGSINQAFTAYNGNLTSFDMSGFTGTITKIWADQGSLSALTTKGEIWSAGYNTAGQFGNGSTATYQSTPLKFNMPVAATDLYESLSSNTNVYQNLYAVGSNGRIYGAGANTFGQLGNGTTGAVVSTPVVMSVIDGSSIVASQVKTGYGTTVVFTTNGSVYTVGNNGSGQLGDGTTTNRSTPIKAQYVNNLAPTTY